MAPHLVCCLNRILSDMLAGLGGLGQHILRQDAVTAGGVVHEYVGDSAYQLAVLEDGAAAHTLDDTAGGIQQAGVRNL